MDCGSAPRLKTVFPIRLRQGAHRSSEKMWKGYFNDFYLDLFSVIIDFCWFSVPYCPTKPIFQSMGCWILKGPSFSSCPGWIQCWNLSIHQSSSVWMGSQARFSCRNLERLDIKTFFFLQLKMLIAHIVHLVRCVWIWKAENSCFSCKNGVLRNVSWITIWSVPRQYNNNTSFRSCHTHPKNTRLSQVLIASSPVDRTPWMPYSTIVFGGCWNFVSYWEARINLYKMN